MGHASLSSTQIYTEVDTARLMEVHREAPPSGAAKKPLAAPRDSQEWRSRGRGRAC